MSYVCNVIILTGVFEEKAIEQINSLWARPNHNAEFSTIKENAGGYKAMECGVWMAAFNYLPLPELFRAVKFAPWDCPDDVQLLVKDQDDRVFKLYALEEDEDNTFIDVDVITSQPEQTRQALELPPGPDPDLGDDL